jgi:hypothetical protein
MNQFSSRLTLLCLLALAATTIVVAEEEGGGGEDPYKKYWVAHGICASLAWAILIPLGIFSAVLRRQFVHAGFSEGTWFQVHRALNSLAAILTIIAFALAVHVIREEDGKSNWKEDPHFTVGLVIFIATLVQVTLAFFRPKHHTHTTGCDHDASKLQNGASDMEEVDMEEVPKEKAAHEESHKPSLLRCLWEHKHRYFGLALLATAWWQIQDGWELYEEEIGGKDVGNVWLAAAGGISGFGVIIYAVHKAGEKFGNKD